MAIRVAINGFGRIGRSVLRAALGGGHQDIDIVAINDIARPDMAAYLFEFDSTFGPFRGEVQLEDGALVVNVGRGPTVDTDALVDHVRRGRIRVASDVFDPEPLPEDHPLWRLDGVFITNAVRCVPPGNKPTSAEIHACRQFLAAQLDALPGLADKTLVVVTADHGETQEREQSEGEHLRGDAESRTDRESLEPELWHLNAPRVNRSRVAPQLARRLLQDRLSSVQASPSPINCG